MKSLATLSGMCLAVCGLLIVGCAQQEQATVSQTTETHDQSTGEWTGPLFRMGPSGRTPYSIQTAKGVEYGEPGDQTEHHVGTEAQPAAYEAETRTKTETKDANAWPRVGPAGRK